MTRDDDNIIIIIIIIIIRPIKPVPLFEALPIPKYLSLMLFLITVFHYTDTFQTDKFQRNKVSNEMEI